jgi:hypothetical protein
MAADASHSFRYEPELCSLPEGQTLSEWRRDRTQEARPARRRGLRRAGRTRGGGAPRIAPASSR